VVGAGRLVLAPLLAIVKIDLMRTVNCSWSDNCSVSIYVLLGDLAIGKDAIFSTICAMRIDVLALDGVLRPGVYRPFCIPNRKRIDRNDRARCSTVRSQDRRYAENGPNRTRLRLPIQLVPQVR
jgi:hypothetical protein